MFIKQRNHLCDRFLKLYLYHRVTHASVCVYSYMGMCDRKGAFYAYIYTHTIVYANICIYVSMNMYVSVYKFYSIFITI